MCVHGSVLLYGHRNHKAHWDGEPRTSTSTFTQLLNSLKMALIDASLKAESLFIFLFIVYFFKFSLCFKIINAP